MKSKTPSYILTLQLHTELFQEYIIDKRLEIARNIQNALINVALKKYYHMLDSKLYTKNKKQLNNINKLYHSISNKKEKSQLNKKRKLLYDKRKDIYSKFGLTQYSLYADVKSMYKHFKDNIGSIEAQAIADNVWSAFDDLLYGDGDKVYFKKYGTVNSIQNKWNKSGLKYDEKSNMIIWNGLKIPIIIKKNDIYAQKAIRDRVKFCRIVRKLIRGTYKYYVQLTLEGIPPTKVDKSTGEIKRSLGQDDVGLDIGTRTLAISSKYDVKLVELCPEIDNIEHQKWLLSRKLDRSRRKTNPDNYNDNGIIKKGIIINGKRTKLKWIKSNHYIKILYKLKDIYRKQADIRKQSHEILSNYILSLGDKFYVEKMNFSGLQKKTKKTTKNKKGKFNKKKRFGKSLANKAPAMLIEILNRKLGYYGSKINKINTTKVKASQYNHITNEYNKKELKDRWNKDIGIQRDMYSAFLIMNVNDTLDKVDRNKCFNTFDNFKVLHDKEIDRLKGLKKNGNKLISSMGI